MNNEINKNNKGTNFEINSKILIHSKEANPGNAPSPASIVKIIEETTKKKEGK